MANQVELEVNIISQRRSCQGTVHLEESFIEKQKFSPQKYLRREFDIPYNTAAANTTHATVKNVFVFVAILLLMQIAIATTTWAFTYQFRSIEMISLFMGWYYHGTCVIKCIQLNKSKEKSL